MSRKIIGVTVGTTLPKPDFLQSDSSKGDYIKNKPDFDGLQKEVSAISGLVGDKPVSEQIQEAFGDISGAVRYDERQELTEEQRAQARHNINAVNISNIYKTFLYEPYTYTWDGSTKGRESFTVKYNNYSRTYYKVSDDIPFALCDYCIDAHIDYSDGFFDEGPFPYGIYKGEKYYLLNSSIVGSSDGYMIIEESGVHTYGDNDECTFEATAGVYFPDTDPSTTRLTLTFAERTGIYLDSDDNPENKYIIEVSDNGALKTVDSNGNVVWDGSDIAGTITTDNTLSKSGVPADAKAVGDAFQVDKFTVELGANGTLGGYKTGDVIEEDTDIKTILNKLLRKAIPATYTRPTLSLSNNDGTASGNVEAGSTVTPKLKAVFTKNDSSGLISINIMKGNEVKKSGTDDTLTYEEDSFVIGDETVTYKAYADYDDAITKTNNLEEECREQWFEGDRTDIKYYSITGKRQLFYGAGEGALPIVTSDVVRGLSNKKLAPANGESFNFNIDIGQQHIIIAYPNNLKDIDNITYVTANDPDFIGKFTKVQEDVDVADARGGENGLAKYKVYTYAMDVPAKTLMSFKFTIKK